MISIKHPDETLTIVIGDATGHGAHGGNYGYRN
jgi:hypothetical protein